MFTFNELCNYLKDLYLEKFDQNKSIFNELIFFYSQKVKSPENLISLRNEKIDFDHQKLEKSLQNYFQEFQPLEYIIHKKIFHGLEFYVDNRVLIPRDETQTVLDTFINDTKSIIKPNDAILDLCTGSGCLAISIAKEFNTNPVYASDFSQDALNVALKNIEIHNIKNLELIHANFLDVLQQIPNPVKFVICNPPYLDYDDPLIQKSVSNFEPSMALYAPFAGLHFYQVLFNEMLTNHQFKPKVVICELNHTMAHAIHSLAFPLRKNYNINLVRDLNNDLRVIKLILK
ncbi:HemK family protein methyltransferase [[Mycoplasma] testudinis]|uniref:HemK family protein methyltransferase n=1 Tax=[Mycoplasma] testudinis TaxID=33924 RepID=UPI00069918FC|nr:HemK family protein methyltransferase [[Mycoplasma] testudinis]